MNTVSMANDASRHGMPMGVLDARTALADVQALYPGFDHWYWNKVVPDLGKTRALFLSHAHGEISGVVIAKRDFHERKLCTVWVDPRFRCGSVASALMDEAGEWLGTSAPMITIPERTLHLFRSILNSGRYERTQVLRGYYRDEDAEHVFNGYLPDPGAATRLRA